MVTIALVGVGIIGTLFVIRPDLLSVNPLYLPKTSVTVLVDEGRDLSPGVNQSYEIHTADSKAMRVIIYPRNVEAKLAVNIYYDNQNKTFDDKGRLTYVVDFNNPLDLEIIPEHDSTVIVELQPFNQSDVDVKISLRYVR